MNKKKNNLSDRQKEDLRGFEDLFEEFLDDQDEAKLKAQIANDKNYDSFKTYNHLELERNRIKKLSAMITRKIPNVIEHNQSEAIVDKFTTYNFHLREEIVDEIKKFDSTFNKNIRLLFNKAFKKK